MKKKQIFDEFETLGKRLGLRIIKGRGDFNAGVVKLIIKRLLLLITKSH